MKEQIENLIEGYSNRIRDIIYSASYKGSSKGQTVSTLRDIINDLKLIINNDRTTDTK